MQDPSSAPTVHLHEFADATADVVATQLAYDLGTLDWPRVDAAGTPEDTLARDVHRSHDEPARCARCGVREACTERLDID